MCVCACTGASHALVHTDACLHWMPTTETRRKIRRRAGVRRACPCVHTCWSPGETGADSLRLPWQRSLASRGLSGFQHHIICPPPRILFLLHPPASLFIMPPPPPPTDTPSPVNSFCLLRLLHSSECVLNVSAEPPPRRTDASQGLGCGGREATGWEGPAATNLSPPTPPSVTAKGWICGSNSHISKYQHPVLEKEIHQSG